MSGDHLFTLRVMTRNGQIIIKAYDGNAPMSATHHRIEVEVRQAGNTIFERGQLYCGLPTHRCIDSLEAKELVLSLVAMQPGDTDSDYFVEYTSDQLDWAGTYGDLLTCEREVRYCDPETGAVRVVVRQ